MKQIEYRQAIDACSVMLGVFAAAASIKMVDQDTFCFLSGTLCLIIGKAYDKDPRMVQAELKTQFSINYENAGGNS